METFISKWGNNLGLRIPKSLAKRLGISEGSSVELKVEKENLIITPKIYSLHNLLAGITKENLHGEISFGKVSEKKG